MLNSIKLFNFQNSTISDPQLLTDIFRIFFYFHSIVLFLLLHQITDFKTTNIFYDPSFLSMIFASLIKEPSYHGLIKTLFLMTSFFTMIGFFTSIFKYLSFLFILLLFLPMNDYSFFHHGPNILIINFLLLTQAPIGKKLALDNYLFKNKKRDEPIEDMLFYLKAFKIFWVFVFFTAGIFKLVNNNFLWLKVDVLGEILRINQDHYLTSIFTSKIFFNSIGNLIIDNYSLGRFLTIATLIIELIMPLCLFRKKKSLRIVSIGLIMLLSIQLLMGHPFFMYLLPNALAFVIIDKMTGETPQE